MAAYDNKRTLITRRGFLAASGAALFAAGLGTIGGARRSLFEGAENTGAAITDMIAAASPGSTITLGPYAYRENVTCTKALTIQGVSGTVIKGSDVWTSEAWTGSGPTWTSTLSVPTFAPHDAGASSALWCRVGSGCLSMEQVFVDGVRQVQVTDTPTFGQFALDGARRVILGQDPSGKKVEVSTRQGLFTAVAENIAIKGVKFSHCANSGQRGAIENYSSLGFVMDSCEVEYAHGAGISASTGSQSVIQNSDIHHNGQMGILSYQADLEVLGNHVHHNNVENYNPEWAAGGMKLVDMYRSVVAHNNVHHNYYSDGIWHDIWCRNTIIEHNRCHNNGRTGIHYEVSGSPTDRAEIRYNVVYNNATHGIHSSSSFGPRIHHNAVAFNGVVGILVVDGWRTDYPAYNGVTHNEVYENDILHIVGASSAEDVRASKWWGYDAAFYDASSSNIGYSNRYWVSGVGSTRSKPETTVNRFEFNGSFPTLAEFNSTLGEERGVYLTNRQKDALVSTHGLPLQQG